MKVAELKRVLALAYYSSSPPKNELERLSERLSEQASSFLLLTFFSGR